MGLGGVVMMGLGGIVGKIRKVLGKITDLLNIGRKQGWWSKKHGLPVRRRK